jgi:hypothetical protein
MAARLLRFSSSTSPLLSAARPLSNTSNNSFFRLQQLQRTMATAAPKTEWLAIVPDFPNTTEKRLEVRPYVASHHFLRLLLFLEPGSASVC